jgi:uncharacterized protein
MTDNTAMRGASAAERITLVDALRGFALAGILFANSLYFSGWDFWSPEQAAAVFGAEATARLWFWHKFLIDGRFYTIFSLLFGLGFALQLARLEARGADGLRIFRRRLLVLLGFGLIHLCLIWDGDILTLYALLGFLLPLFRHLSGRALLAWAFGLLMLPFAAAPLFRAMGWAPWNALFAIADAINPRTGSGFRDFVPWLQRPDWASFFAWKSTGWVFRIWMLFDFWRIPKVLGTMLMGMWVGRRLIAGTLLADRRLLGGVAVGGLLIGLPGGWLYATTPGVDQNSLGSMLGTAPLGLAYAAAFVLAWSWTKPVLGMLAAPGRMALSNYLAQSVIGIAIYFGVGFGLVGHAAPGTVLAIATATFAVQVLWSHLWLARFSQGPMEWLWRRLTYARGGRSLVIAPAI